MHGRDEWMDDRQTRYESFERRASWSLLALLILAGVGVWTFLLWWG